MLNSSTICGGQTTTSDKMYSGESASSERWPFTAPVVSLPKGVSAIQGTGEKFISDGVIHTSAFETACPVLICLFGEFRVLKGGQPAALNSMKAETLLRYLALHSRGNNHRDVILESLWPGQTSALAGQSLNTLIYSLRKLFGDELHGASPVLQHNGHYQLNRGAGVGVDVTQFQTLINVGNQHVLGNNLSAAIPYYFQAAQLYQGDLCASTDTNTIVEREHLRAQFLTVLARLAGYHFSVKEYSLCQNYAQQLLEYDPCREDAHRLVMRCYVRQGERAQALRQYCLCESILRAEFDITPESCTTLLYNQVRLDPDGI